jgi:8-oxo-dGTP pyrophosphatase MutT (NUDIX family)
MWLITNFGFLSIVEKPEDEEEALLTIRARVRSDLDALRHKYLPALGPISKDAGTDYKYRARAPRLAVASALGQLALEIDYSNFKDSVAKNQGSERATLYHELWDVLYKLQTKKSAESPLGKSKKMSYGGVLLNGEKHVLLRRPKGDFDGYVWTFPKGKGEPGASPEDTALREVKEETGYTAEIVGKIPGQFEGGTGSTEYFVMRPLGEPAPFDRSETEVIAWVSLDDAVKHIAQTRNEIGRRRDQSVLAAVNRYIGKHATRFSWRITDMPAKQARLPFGMRFSPGEVARLRKGHIPQEMEDKWFIFFENDWLNFHRSWTGYCIYRLRLQQDGECYRVAEAWVNRSPKQYKNKKLATDEKHLLALLFSRFAIGSEPPSDL